jgi:Putative Ig domain
MPYFKQAAVCLRHASFCVLASLPLFASSFASAGTAFTVSGSAPTTATVGSAYSFQPTVSDASGRTVTFEIYNKPSWASFNSATGRLYGTPATANVGAYKWVQIAGSDGTTTSWLPAYTLTVSAASSSSGGSGSTSGGGSTAGGSTSGGSTTTGTKLTVSGTPPATATVGTAYSFQPTTTVPSGMTVTYSVYNKPSWASFNSTTGRLYGTPTAANVGTYRWVQISGSDGQATSWLPAYTLTVNASTATTPPPSTGTVTISWTPPTENTDGSALTNLSGYHIYYGTSQSNLNQVVNITNPGLATYVLSNLSAATYYFAMTAVTSSGLESARSSVVSRVVQ